jgi:hypothetical protein
MNFYRPTEENEDIVDEGKIVQERLEEVLIMPKCRKATQIYGTNFEWYKSSSK